MKKYKLVKTYPGSPVLGTIAEDAGSIKYTLPDGKSYNESSSKGSEFERLISSQPEYWKEIVSEEYKIIAFKQNSGIGDLWTEFYHGRWCRNEDGRAVTSSYTIKEMLDNNLYFIHSIKRLSDGEIFTIGDKIQTSMSLTIYSFIIIDNELLVSPFEIIGTISLHKIKKLKPYLFTTEDGVDIYEGDNYYQVHNFKILTGEDIKTPTIDKESKFFSLKTNAKKYIIYNKPVLSYNDVKMSTTYSSVLGYILNMNKLRDIFKKRIKDF